MARYTCSYIISIPIEQLQPLLGALLKDDCCCEVIYSTNDYIMAREAPGNVSFAKLVTVEVLMDATLATHQSMRINFVVKNEELPLQIGNHCQQIFQLLQQAIATKHQQWKMIGEAISSPG